MKSKLLLVGLLMSFGILNAQDDTIRTLVITEARMNPPGHAYCELTNMGTETIDLVDFEFGEIPPWTDPYNAADENRIMIGEYINMYKPGMSTLLEPGESFWMSTWHDFGPEQYPNDPDNFSQYINKEEQANADIVFHCSEPKGDATDSVSVGHSIFVVYHGRHTWYLRHHVSEEDSVVVDQVGGVFDNNGRNFDHGYDVAGFVNATGEATLVRKYSIKEGNTNFAEGRGLDLGDSEWMPIEFQQGTYEPRRKMFWTVDNHGDYNLDASTLVSTTVDLDWENKVINVPWGIHNEDSVMMQFEYREGLAWHYTLSPERADSAYISARTGDVLTVYACGNDLDVVDFDINLLPPTDDDNVVIPKIAPGDWGAYSIYPAFEVTDGVPGMDTILNVAFGTRSDTIEKYLEKAPQAAWEFIWVDGVERPEVKHGDILRVTSKNGASKDYFIDVEDYRPSHNAYLSSITWPDIPEFYKGVFGYVGDTIPNFLPKSYDYKAIVPADYNGIPALIAKAEDVRTKIEVTRAVNLYGTVEDRTVTFKTTAEDDTTIRIYKVLLEKEKSFIDVQPNKIEPFLSQVVWRDQWSNNFWEICNPGTHPLDLSQYMFMMQWTNDPYQMITWDSEATRDGWNNRYKRYIPGRKWVGLDEWTVDPVRCEEDLNINSNVKGGDVFVITMINSSGVSGYPWWASEQSDIDFAHNPWDESISPDSAYWSTWTGVSFYMFKILNDSVRDGTKSANDPADFEVVEAWAGLESGTEWVIGGRPVNYSNQTVTYIRKPEVYTPKAGNAESWGTTTNMDTNVPDGTSEWLMYDSDYGDANNLGYPMNILYITEDIGKHSLNEITDYRSTVTSTSYKVTTGFSMEEEIRGLLDGVTGTDFLSAINKAHEDQTLTIRRNGVALTGDDVVLLGDSLIVVSANGLNTSRYHLEVTSEGLSDDATLSSETYTVSITAPTGTITGFEYGTTLKTVFDAVEIAEGANLDVVDGDGAYVSMKIVNFDTAYVDVLVNDQIFFLVTAEDGATQISYQLVPNSAATDAFVISEVYMVDQENMDISLIPEGTTVASFYSNVIPAAGASIVLKDKAGFERTLGNIYFDDTLHVTAADGVTMAKYSLTELVRDTIYNAIVRSNVYDVDQGSLAIDGGKNIADTTLVSEVLSNLIPSRNAVITILDSDQNEKDPGDKMVEGDIVMVVSGDGVTVRYYSITVVSTVSVESQLTPEILIYPNPSSGRVHISGLEINNRIQIFNTLGQMVHDRMAYNNEEVITMDGEQSGVYFVVVSDKNERLGHYKLIIQ